MTSTHLFLALLITTPLVLHFGLILFEEFRDEIGETVQGYAFRKSKKRERIDIEVEFPLIVELFAILIGGGMSPSSALALISEKGSGAFIEILRPIVRETVEYVYEGRYRNPFVSA